jgi:colicin import membrane protein
MAERRENSVLFSLKELRNIEDERVKQEEDAERARIEAERRAREEEIRRAKEAEQQRILAEQERVRQEEDQRNRLTMEGELRLKEAERRAQIEASAKLEQARIEAEARARIDGKKFPVGLVVGGVVALVLLSGGVMLYLVNQHTQELAQARAAAEAEKQALATKVAQEKKEFEQQITDLQKSLDKAANDAERQKIKAQIAQASVAHEHRSSAIANRKADEAATPKTPKRIKAESGDPLQGLGL